VFINTSEGRRIFGKPRKRRSDNVENDLKEMGVRGWRKIAGGIGHWKLTLMEGSVVHGQ
jgi:hypothetical protein